MTNHNKLLLALVFGSMSYSATAKVYSWRGEDGAMHYSQFPRELVEKNSAQSRESRNIEDLADVVDDLDDQDDSNLLDGLDDIVANASVVREKDKVLKRTAPEVILAAQATVLEQQAGVENGDEEKALTAANSKPTKQNPFLANIHKRLNKRTADSSRDTLNNTISPEPAQTVAITQTEKTERVSARIKPQNRFLAGIKSKLNGRPTVSSKDIVVTKEQESVSGALSVQSSNEPVTTVASIKSEKQQVQNKFLAEINKKLFRARLATNTELVSATENIQKATHTKANAGKDLSRSADKIKTIEKQAETKAADAKPELPRQSSSALMLSRLSSNHVGRLSLVDAGTDQLDRQGIDSANKFVNDINRSAEK